MTARRYKISSFVLFAAILLATAYVYAQNNSGRQTTALPQQQNTQAQQEQSPQEQSQPKDTALEKLNDNSRTVLGAGRDVDPATYSRLQEALRAQIALKSPEVSPAEIPSLFFTLWQHALLQEAKKKFNTRPPEQRELAEQDKPGDTLRKPGIREISLGGISYTDSSEWTVWLNSKRIKPNAIPKEIMDIKVRKNYVKLKWYDEYTNLIYPIKLQPHQRFNLDTRIFLPGVGDEKLQ